MKRYLYLIFIMVLSLIFISGCAETTDWEPTEYENVNNIDDVSMTVKEGTVSPTGLTVVLENNSDVELIYSEDFLLEKNINGKWYEVPVIVESYGFDDIGYILASGEIGEWNVEWSWLYGNLDAGEYRIIKIIIDSGSPGDIKQYILAAEFKILSNKNN
ncbi:MAG: hypothetical protein GX024_11230 [Clostridiales bacterium]|nr:hypothetical protein [Clostridiales bacterium]